MKTVITELLGIEYPVIQGGMAWVGTAELAAAVSKPVDLESLVRAVHPLLGGRTDS